MTGQLIRTITIKGLTEDGESPEITSLRLTLTDEGYEVDYLLDGQVVDGYSAETRADAERQAHEWAIKAHQEYEEEERERKAEQRRERRDLINDLAGELAGDDAKALRMLAALIGQGRSAEAVTALRSINQRRRRDA